MMRAENLIPVPTKSSSEVTGKKLPEEETIDTVQERYNRWSKRAERFFVSIKSKSCKSVSADMGGTPGKSQCLKAGIKS